MSDKNIDIFYFSGTHWDREWYLDFQGFRFKLVRMVDSLLDLLRDDEDFRTFHFDGQTVVLEDYAETAPERAAELDRRIAEGRILVGPWYVMPDEYLVSGESLVRNLMLGHKIAADHGAKAWKYGYVCDIFGHIAQMPQIFAKFGIKYALLGRGNCESDPTYFKWRAPDGSECVTFRLEPDYGYGSFKMLVRERGAKTDDEIKRRIKTHIDGELARGGLPIVVLMDAHDHTPACADTSRYIRLIKEVYPNARVHHTDLCRAGEIIETAGLPVINGELNRTAEGKHEYLHLITNTLSSRYPIKKANDEICALLEKTVEPLCAFAAADGGKTYDNFVSLAWKYVLKNHAHDTICGCSADRVYPDADYRFAQARGICTAVIDDILPRRSTDGECIMMTVHNPLPFETERSMEVQIPFDGDFPHYAEPFGYEEINAFRIIDSDGNEVPYRVTDIKRRRRRRLHDQVCLLSDVHTVSMRVKLPPCGSAQYKIVPCEGSVRYMKHLESGADYAENEFVRVTVTRSGTVDLHDKISGKTYTDLCSFADDGEIGDGWYHAAHVNDETVYSHGAAQVAKVLSSPSRCVFRITRVIDLPRGVAEDRFGKRRSDETVGEKIVMYVGLSAGERFADVRLEVDNAAKDHRLRLMMPSGIAGGESFAGQAFCEVRRKVGIDYSTQDYCETEQYEKAMNGIVGKRGADGCGLGFVSKSGLHEYGAFDDARGTVAVTLLRCFSATVMTDGEVSGQLIGKHEFEFLLVPLDGGVGYPELLRMKDMLECEPICSFEAAPCDAVPTRHSYMSISGDSIAASCIKRAADGENGVTVVRVFNPTASAAEGRIDFESAIAAADEVNLNEEFESKARFDENGVAVRLAPWEIKTYKIKLRR